MSPAASVRSARSVRSVGSTPGLRLFSSASSVASYPSEQYSASTATSSMVRVTLPLAQWVFAGVVAAVQRIAMYSYTPVTTLVTRMLACIAVDGQRVLYFAGGIACSAGFQAPLWVAFVLIVAPLPLFMVGLVKHMHRKHHMVPLVYDDLSSLNSLEEKGTSSMIAAWARFMLQHPHQAMWMRTFVAAFHPDHWYYGSVLMVTRLCFSVVHAFTFDSFLRSLLMVGIAISSLVFHMVVQPFRVRSANVFATVTMAITCMVGTIAVHESSLTTFGGSSTVDKVSTGARTTVVVVCLFPAASLCAGGLVRLAAKFCRCGRRLKAPPRGA